MLRSVGSARDYDYLRLLARLLWRPGVQRRLDLSDVVQETLLQAHKNIDQFRGDTDEQWRGWLRTILWRVLWRAVGHNQLGEASLNESSRHWEEVLAAQHSSPSERALRNELLERLAAALGQLDEDERTAVELQKLYGCSVEFISQYMDRTKLAVGGLLRRGKHKLRLLLREKSREEEKG
jgi:RNA polymerase sigma-70 factor (ECF subfamily)